MASKIVNYLLVSLVLSLGFGQLLRFDFLGIPVYLHDILVLSLLIFSLGKLKLKLYMRFPGISLLLSGIIIGWFIALLSYPLTLLFAPFLYTLRILAYLLLYFILQDAKSLLSVKTFQVSGFVMLVIGFAQYFFMPDMRWAQYLGWDDHLSRLTLPHFDPTFSAVMLSLALLAQIRNFNLTSLIYHLSSIIAILLSYSRSVWLSLVITGLFFVKNPKIILASLILFLVCIYALPQKFGEGTNLLRTFSISSRIQSDLTYVSKYQWRMLLGRGMNTLALDTEPTKFANHATGPNNSYLFILLTSGVIGLVGWILFIRKLYQTSTYKPMMAFFFIASFFNNVIFYAPALLWVLLIQVTKVPSEA